MLTCMYISVMSLCKWLRNHLGFFRFYVLTCINMYVDCECSISCGFYHIPQFFDLKEIFVRTVPAVLDTDKTIP